MIRQCVICGNDFDTKGTRKKFARPNVKKFVGNKSTRNTTKHTTKHAPKHSVSIVRTITQKTLKVFTNAI